MAQWFNSNLWITPLLVTIGEVFVGRAGPFQAGLLAAACVLLVATNAGGVRRLQRPTGSPRGRGLERESVAKAFRRANAQLPGVSLRAIIVRGGSKMPAVADLDQVLALRLSALDKVRLIQGLAPRIEQDLREMQPVRVRSLFGLCADLGPAPSAEMIDAARREAWSGFPREDV